MKERYEDVKSEIIVFDTSDTMNGDVIGNSGSQD